jgi:hypothetical protein
VYNYDYVLDHIFHLNGAIELRGSTSGYLQSTFWYAQHVLYLAFSGLCVCCVVWYGRSMSVLCQNSDAVTQNRHIDQGVPILCDARAVYVWWWPHTTWELQRQSSIILNLYITTHSHGCCATGLPRWPKSTSISASASVHSPPVRPSCALSVCLYAATTLCCCACWNDELLMLY